MQTTRTPLADLKVDPKNARQHDAKNLQAIKDSLTRFGQVEPLVVQQGTGMVVGGNGRLAAMRALGWQEADVVELPLTKAEATALSIALNRTGELGTWDIGTLQRGLSSLADEMDLTILGFDDHELRRLVSKPLALPDGGAEEVVAGHEPVSSAPGGHGEHDGDEEPEDDEDEFDHTQPSPVRQPKPVVLYFEGDDAQAFLRIAKDAEELLGVRGHAEVVLAALRRICGQSIFPEPG